MRCFAAELRLITADFEFELGVRVGRPRRSERCFAAPASSCFGKEFLTAHLPDFDLHSELELGPASFTVATEEQQLLEAVGFACVIAFDWYPIIAAEMRRKR